LLTFARLIAMSLPILRSPIFRKFRARFTVILLFVCGLGLFLSPFFAPQSIASLPEPIAVMAITQSSEQIIPPLPQSIALNPQKVDLGRQLFHDPQLSRDGQFSCASCHNLQMGGDDGEVQSIGRGDVRLAMNSPTVLNSAYNFRQFWDGRSVSLEDQINHPLKNDQELGRTWPQVIERLKRDRNYATQFQRLYPQSITAETVRDAIATFERSLITPSRFDQFLRGEKRAITVQEKAGYDKFQSYGCVACHQGVNLGGNMFQRLGVMRDYYASATQEKSTAQGRFNLTGNPQDRYVFKVPTLRNVAETAPYLHDGSIETLTETVQIMAKYQLGQPMPESDVADIVAFLKSLSGQIPSSVAQNSIEVKQ
jgi:cytochrome c peroxidase